MLLPKNVSNLWFLSRIKEYLSTDQIIQFYKAYIQPSLIIAIQSGEALSKDILTGYIDTKRAYKIILDYQYENITISMEVLKILNIYERIYPKKKKAKIMYKIIIQIQTKL